MTRVPEWRDQVGSVWAAEWRRTDRSFAGLSIDLDAAIRDAAPTGAGTAFDIGCGAGATSLALATARPDVRITGLDVSADLVGIAERRAAGTSNVRFAITDVAAALPDMPPLDLLFSRHGVMFFDDPAAALARLHAAASPGAPLVFSCFRSPTLNPWAGDLVAAMTGEAPVAESGYVPGPFAFADPDIVAPILADAGWRDAAPVPIDYRYVAGQGADPVADAIGFLRRIGPVSAALRTAPEHARAAMLDKLAARLQEHIDTDVVAFPAAAWIWRARA